MEILADSEKLGKNRAAFVFEAGISSPSRDYRNALTERRFHKHGQRICSLTCEDIDLSHLTQENQSIGNLKERGDTLNRVLAVRQEYLYHRQPKDYRL